MELAKAIEVFVNGFGTVRSRTHPSIASCERDVWLMEDGPRKSGNRRKSEAVNWKLTPAAAIENVRSRTDHWTFLSDVRQTEAEAAEAKAEYKRLGYRPLKTEWMYFHDLKDIPAPGPIEIRKVLTAEARDAMRIFMGAHPWSLETLTEGEVILYGAYDDEGQILGNVSSVRVGAHSWVSDLFVHEDARRQGVGSALMSTLLRGDQDRGVERNVLLATKAGANLYPVIGYQSLGILQIFCPAR
jgi:GNAT superfamily N-acetyltransferase